MQGESASPRFVQLRGTLFLSSQLLEHLERLGHLVVGIRDAEQHAGVVEIELVGGDDSELFGVVPAANRFGQVLAHRRRLLPSHTNAALAPGSKTMASVYTDSRRAKYETRHVD